MSRIDCSTSHSLPLVVTISAIENGWLTLVEQQRSPNYDARPKDCVPELLVIHAISLPLGVFSGALNTPPYIEQLFLNQLNPAAHADFEQLSGVRVSAHFLIRRDGSLVQFVSANDRAWHAGLSHFAGRERCNDFSIGVELEGSDFVPFEKAQYASLVQLTAALLQHYPIHHIVGHEDIAPNRKTDPGPFFDWECYQNSLQKHFPLVIANPAIRFRTAD
jgi:AmpD protein